MNKKNHIKSFLAWAQVMLFCLILANGIFCIHSHKLANGQIVVHAHPYFPQEDGTSLPNNHSASELILLGQFFHTGIVFSGISFIDFSAPEIEIFFQRHEFTFNAVKQYFFCTNHRGPPTYC
jgi:hypothetical protein